MAQSVTLSKASHTRVLLLIALDTSQDCALSAKERPASSRMFMLSDVMAAVSATR
jgi:hypothetical protein